METFEQKWQGVQELMLARFGKIPDMEGMLYLIGVNELDQLPEKAFSKEQKQDLMHVAVCTLLSQVGYFELAGRDAEGWPHFHTLDRPEVAGLADQEKLLKECIIRYFE